MGMTAAINWEQIAVRREWATPSLKARLTITRIVFSSRLEMSADDSTTQQARRLALLLTKSVEVKV